MVVRHSGCFHAFMYTGPEKMKNPGFTTLALASADFKTSLSDFRV